MENDISSFNIIITKPQVGECLASTDSDRNVDINNQKLENEKLHNIQKDNIQKQRIRTIVRFMLEKRKRKWRRDFGWVEDDLDRIFRNVEALPEELQDFSIPMVIVGSDVEALYPSLDTERVARMV